MRADEYGCSNEYSKEGIACSSVGEAARDAEEKEEKEGLFVFLCGWMRASMCVRAHTCVSGPVCGCG